jgi:hypothetical protein
MGSDRPMQFVRMSEVASIFDAPSTEVAELIRDRSSDPHAMRSFADFVHNMKSNVDSKQEGQS